MSFCVIMHDAFRFFKIYLVYIHLGTVLGVWLQNFSLRVSHCLNYPSYWLIAEGSMILANIWRRFSLSLSYLYSTLLSENFAQLEPKSLVSSFCDIWSHMFYWITYYHTFPFIPSLYVFFLPSYCPHWFYLLNIFTRVS